MKSPKIYNVRGRLVRRDGQPAAGWDVIVLDQDEFLDDFLDQTKTDADGRFHAQFSELAFTTTLTSWAERGPDLYLVAKAPDAVEPRRLEPLWPDVEFTEADLGNIDVFE